jgi:UDP-N-acetylglucosamine 2-epimerase (non-hydrolysing)
MLPEVHLLAGTRPEAIKLAPVAAAIRAAGRMRPVLVATGQHPTMVAEALAALGEKADVTLDLDRVTGSQPELLSQLVKELDAHFAATAPAIVVVQGDTTTTLAGAMAAFWRRLPVVHLEAGLRSGDLAGPFPEEGNRRMVAQISALHLAPTQRAADNLLAEGTDPAKVIVIGNTVVDAALAVAARPVSIVDSRVATVVALSEAGRSRLALVTAHRRESWGEPLDRVLAAVRRLLEKYSDLWVVLPAHPNPAVRAQVDAALAGVERALVTDPLPYESLARVLSRATIVLTDSGGIQEEAPSFQVPALVLREVTERVESVEAGCARLVGTDEDTIVTESCRLLDDPAAYASMVVTANPYGDGFAADRTEQAVAALLGLDLLPAPYRPASPAATGLPVSAAG